MILYLAHPTGMYGAPRPRWWWRGGVREHLFKTYNGTFSHLLCGYGCTLTGYKQLWSIERKRELFGEPKVHDVLALGSTPIFFTYPKAAKVLAQLCYPNPPKEAEAKGLRWIPITT
jgi:hypothetical protein